MEAASPVDHVGLHARLQPEHLALVDLASGARWTYAALDRIVAQTARVLREKYRVGVGDRVASLARNHAGLVILHHACARIGAIYTPLNWRLSEVEIQALLDDAAPKLLVGDSELKRLFIKGVALKTLLKGAGAAEPLPEEPIDPTRVSLLLYTSGTSGHPKGVMLSEANIGETAANFSLLGRVTHESVFLLDSPMFHIIGIISSVRPTLLRGGVILISDGFDPARTLARLGDPALGVTHYFCVPQMAAMLRASPDFDPGKLKHMTAIFTGGAPHPAEAIRAWVADGIPIVDGFGMSEAGTVFGMPVNLDIIAAKAGSAGIGTPAIESRIVDSTGRDCGPGEPGELLLRGPNVTRGYWNRPAETEAAFTADGWFQTGDVVMRDEDGFHYLVDRKKDMFISGGENVYPAEIEAVLAGFPGLAEIAVVGVPDARWGEVGLCAYVVAPAARVTERDLLELLEAKLARYKLPKHFRALESLPRTGSGKVQKNALRALLAGRESQA